MAVMDALVVPYDGWTVDDLPELDGRCELVDGALVVTPPPELRHDRMASALHALLRSAAPADLAVLPAAGVRFGQRDYRQPDVVVYDRRAHERDRLLATDVVLAVEVMSPGSVSTDRVTKPAQYAAAGIPHFWRLELDPLVLVVHRLADDAYEVAGQYDDEVELLDPVTVRFRLATLLD